MWGKLMRKRFWIAVLVAMTLWTMSEAQAQEKWVCSYKTIPNLPAQLVKLETKDNMVTMYQEAGPNPSTYDWQIVVDNAYGLVATIGNAALNNFGKPFVWGEVLTINKITREFGRAVLPTPSDTAISRASYRGT